MLAVEYVGFTIILAGIVIMMLANKGLEILIRKRDKGLSEDAR